MSADRLYLRRTEGSMSLPRVSDGDGHRPRGRLLSRRARRGLAALCLIGAATAIAWRAAPAGKAVATRSDAPDANAFPLTPREFVRTLRVTGLTEATRSYVVTVPLQTGGGQESLVITRLARPGSRVARGEVLVEFDRQNQDKLAFDKAAEYRDLFEQI